VIARARRERNSGGDWRRLFHTSHADPRARDAAVLELWGVGVAPAGRARISPATCFPALRYDVAQLGMTTGQCREALDAIGLPHVSVPPAPVDLAAFKSLVPEAV